MTKYWNERRLKRVRQRKAVRDEKRYAKAADAHRRKIERARSYEQGNADKNARLALEALAVPVRLQMVLRLKNIGATSLSNLIEPFNITLPTALTHLRALERSGIVKTHKRGRIRFCVYDRHAPAELAQWIASRLA